MNSQFTSDDHRHGFHTQPSVTSLEKCHWLLARSLKVKLTSFQRSRYFRKLNLFEFRAQVNHRNQNCDCKNVHTL